MEKERKNKLTVAAVIGGIVVFVLAVQFLTFTNDEARKLQQNTETLITCLQNNETTEDCSEEISETVDTVLDAKIK